MKVRIQLNKPLVTKHQSLAHDAIRRRSTSRKSYEMQEAVEWYQNNGCRGWATLKSGLFPSIKCPKSINRCLDGIVVAGEEKRYCSILTSDEEESLVRYIKNRSLCLQGMNATQVEDVILNILKTRQ